MLEKRHERVLSVVENIIGFLAHMFFFVIAGERTLAISNVMNMRWWLYLTGVMGAADGYNGCKNEGGEKEGGEKEGGESSWWWISLDQIIGCSRGM